MLWGMIWEGLLHARIGCLYYEQFITIALYAWGAKKGQIGWRWTKMHALVDRVSYKIYTLLPLSVYSIGLVHETNQVVC